MGKAKIILLLLFWLNVFVHSTASGQTARRAQIGAAIAKQGLFYASQNIIEATNNNDGVPYDLFIKPYNLPKGTFWCMTFVMRCHRDVGFRTVVNWEPLSRNWALPSSVIVSAYGHLKGGTKPQAGDVALYKLDSKHINHGEIVLEWTPADDPYFYIIGGNVSATRQWLEKFRKPNANGKYPKVQGVFVKKRLKSMAIIVRQELTNFPKTT